MREGRCGWLSLSLSVIAVVQVSLIPVSNAQDAPAPGEPQVIDQGNNVAPSQPPPPALSPGPPPVYGPVVILRGSSKARLQLLEQQLQWRDVCVAPCNRPVDPQGTYRIGGGTIRASDPFTMPRPSGQVVIDAQVGSKVKHWVGIALIIGGAVDAIGGTLYYANADSLASSSSTNTSGIGGKEYWQTVGIVGIVTGLILLGIGIPLAMSSTSVEIH